MATEKLRKDKRKIASCQRVEGCDGRHYRSNITGRGGGERERCEGTDEWRYGRERRKGEGEDDGKDEKGGTEVKEAKRCVEGGGEEEETEREKERQKTG